MKTKHKLLSVLAIMAILAGLCVAMISTTASASAPTGVSAKASPATVNSTSAWTVNMTPSGAYATGTVITITFPTGVTMPATVSYSNVTVAGVASTTSDVISVSGQSVQITINAAQSAAITGAFSVVIQAGAGIKNPAVAKPINLVTPAASAYLVKVKSTVDTTEGIGAVGFIPTFAMSPTAANRMTGITVTGQGWTPNSGIAVKGALSGSATADATGSFTATAYYTDAGAAASYGYVVVQDGSGQDPTNATTSTWAAGNAGGETPVAIKYTLLPGITVTPASGNVGSTIEIKGTDFTSGATIAALTMGGVDLIALMTSGSLTLSSIDALGTNDDFKVTVTVPVKKGSAPMNTGSQVVTAADNATTPKSGSGNFSINAPTVTISPATGAPGAAVTLTGKNFKAGDTLAQVSFGATTAWSTAATLVTGSGTWTLDGKVPTNASDGYNIITVYTTAGTITGAYFAVGSRTLTITPSSGPLGTTVVIGGANMTKGTDTITTTDTKVLIYSADVKVQNTALASKWWPNGKSDITVDTNGNIQATTLQIPDDTVTGITAGAITMTVTEGNVTNPATATGTFTVVQPVVTVSPTNGVVGTTLTIVGSGFVPNDDVIINIASSTDQRILARATINETGAFTATGNVPYNMSLQLGDVCKVTIEDTFGNTIDQQTFTVSTGSMTVSPTTGPTGTLVTVTGKGLLPGKKIAEVTIDTWDVTPDKLPQVATDGTVSTTFTVPSFIGTGVKVVAIRMSDDTNYTGFITITTGGGTTGNTVVERLAGIDGQYDQVWTLDAGTWKLFDPSDATNAEFTTLTPGMAIYIHTTQAIDNVNLGGVVRNLVSGWNMIGWVS